MMLSLPVLLLMLLLACTVPEVSTSYVNEAYQYSLERKGWKIFREDKSQPLNRSGALKLQRVFDRDNGEKAEVNQSEVVAGTLAEIRIAPVADLEPSALEDWVLERAGKAYQVESLELGESQAFRVVKREDVEWWAYVPVKDRVIGLACNFLGDDQVSSQAQTEALNLLHSFRALP